MKLKPKLGDVVTISDQMSLKFEKIADDLAPVWMEVPSEKSETLFSDGSYIAVTDELWFIYDQDHWRIMTSNEHVEAYRQNYLSSSSLSQ
jgi:hypothetical protein